MASLVLFMVFGWWIGSHTDVASAVGGATVGIILWILFIPMEIKVLKWVEDFIDADYV